MSEKVEVDRADLVALLEAWQDDGTHGWFNGPLGRLTKLLEPPRCEATATVDVLYASQPDVFGVAHKREAQRFLRCVLLKGHTQPHQIDLKL